MQKHAKQIFWNAMLLTAAALLMRTVGVSFQVYVTGRVGAEAMGLYSLLSGVYGFALTLATSGIQLGVTRVVVDAVGDGRAGEVRGILRRALSYSLFFGVGAACLLGIGAPFVGAHWLKDARTVRSLRLLALTLPLISLSSAWGGYFTAVRRSYKNAAVQVLEQAIKIGVTMYLFLFLTSGDVEGSCCMLVLGGVTAEALSFAVNLILYLSDRRRHFPSDRSGSSRDGRKLLQITLPIAVTAYIRSGLITLEHILIPEGLRRSGSSHAAALVAYGSIQSMALPVVLYPAALISSFSGLLVPELAEARVRGEKTHIRYMIGRVWSLSLLFSLGVSGVLITFSGELGALLYPGTEAGRYIRILSALIPIMYVDTATDAMLKGLGEQVYSMYINVADALISVVLVYLLVPRMGIDGYLVTIFFSEFFNTVCSVTRLLSVAGPRVRPIKWVYKPLFCILTATAAARHLLPLLPPISSSRAATLVLSILFTVMLYLLLILLTRTADREDLLWVRELFTKERAPERASAPPGDGRYSSQNSFSG